MDELVKQIKAVVSSLDIKATEMQALELQKQKMIVHVEERCEQMKKRRRRCYGVLRNEHARKKRATVVAAVFLDYICCLDKNVEDQIDICLSPCTFRDSVIEATIRKEWLLSG